MGLYSKGRYKNRVLSLVIIVIFCFCFYFCPKGVLAATYTWQDFEYWDSPQNHGWITSSPGYPNFGPYPIGSGGVNTLLDISLHSRVMRIEGFPSPFNQFNRFRTWNQSIVYPSGTPINDKEIISMNLASRFGVELFDLFEIQLQLITRKGKYLKLIYRPVGITPDGPHIGMQTEYGKGSNSGGDPGNPSNPLNVVYNIGRQYVDGSWHLIVRNLDEDIQNMGLWNGINFKDDGFGEKIANNPQGTPIFFKSENSKIVSITLVGFSLMVDNIAFHDSVATIINHPPKLQRIGPQYAQLFEKFALVITVKDVDDYFGDAYDFAATIGGYGYRGVQTTTMIHRIRSVPPVTNILDPNSYAGCDWNCVANYCTDKNCNKEEYCIQTLGGEYHRGQCCTGDCEGDKIMLEFIPQTFEDLIITIKVTDPGGLSDIETFPLFVVNYPITNHPPYLEEIEDDIYLLGTHDGFFVKEFVCYDQDMDDDPGDGRGEIPTADHPVVGGHSGNITYKAYIDGKPNYSYGPWQNPLIPKPLVPMIAFSPKFEGKHTIIVIATDPKGYSAMTEFDLIVVNSGTWFNHPPILCEDIDSPQLGRAGEMYTIPVEFFDPDGEPTYYSCNIGSITEITDEFGKTTNSSVGLTIQNNIFDGGIDERYGRYMSGAVYTFLSNFPGIYSIEIVAYDIRGGYCITNFILDIQPWWTF